MPLDPSTLLGRYRAFARHIDSSLQWLDDAALDNYIETDYRADGEDWNADPAPIFDCFAIYGVTKLSILNRIGEVLKQKNNKELMKDLARTQAIVQPQLIDCWSHDVDAAAKKLVETSKDFLFQHGVTIRSITKGEDICNLVFSKGTRLKRKRIVIPLQDADTSGQWANKFDFTRIANPFGRSYMVAVLYEDFADVSVLDLEIKAFTFTKAVVARTKLPLIDLTFDLLDTLIDRVELQRKSIVSAQLGEGATFDEINFSAIDTELATKDLITSFEKVIYHLPRIGELSPGFEISPSTTEEGVLCSWKVPPVEEWRLLECKWGLQEFLTNIRFEELWLLILCIFNEKKLILVSSEVRRLGSAISCLLSMIRPFCWEYPLIIYSKDEHFLDSPFPLIAGISKELATNHLAEKSDTVVFDLDKGEPQLPSPLIHTLTPPRLTSKLAKLIKFHREHFNSAASHLMALSVETSRLVPMPGLREEQLPEETTPTTSQLVEYMKEWEDLWLSWANTIRSNPHLVSAGSDAYTKRTQIWNCWEEREQAKKRVERVRKSNDTFSSTKVTDISGGGKDDNEVFEEF